VRRYSEAVKADIRKRRIPPARQSVTRISEDTGIHIATLYAWRKGWRLEGEVVPASQKDPEGWSAADKFTVVLDSGLGPGSAGAPESAGSLPRVEAEVNLRWRVPHGPGCCCPAAASAL
jgi:transposase-like protein